MGNKQTRYNDIFNFFASGTMFLFAITITLYAIAIGNGGDAMTILFPFIQVFIALGILFAIIAVLNAIRAWQTRNEKTHTEILIEAIAKRLGIDVDKFNDGKPKKAKKEDWMDYPDDAKSSPNRHKFSLD
ncbi:hypothetical protein ACFLUZ_03005 [Chloroflexota bacterium]